MNPTTSITEKQEQDFDIRDVFNYLLGKVWLILLAMICFAVIAIVFASTVTPLYKSSSTLFITSTHESTNNASQSLTNWNVGKQLAVTSPELVTLDFCNDVADELNANSEFTKKYGYVNGSLIHSYITVTSDEDTCIVKFTATTPSKELSADVVNAVTQSFDKYVKKFMNTDTIRTAIAQSGMPPASDSNIHIGRNAIIGAILGAVFSCVVLIVVFMFDDKIKTADDVDRYLNLSVLGVIPEIDVEG